MIFDHVKPTQEDTDALDRALGSGKYAVSYLQTYAGVEIRVRSYEQPGLQWEAPVPTGSTPDQVRDAWRALIIRIGRASSSTPPPDDVIRPRTELAMPVPPIDSISVTSAYENPPTDAPHVDVTPAAAPDSPSFDGGGGDFGGGGASGSFGGDP
jgi:hypothetical protein